jgi:hypothetical protein
LILSLTVSSFITLVEAWKMKIQNYHLYVCHLYINVCCS